MESMSDIVELRRLAASTGLARDSSITSTPAKRVKRKRTEVREPKGRNEMESSFKIPKKLKKTSELVPRNLWPLGMTSSMVDGMTVDQVMTMKGLETKISKAQKSELPGITQAMEDDKIQPVTYPKFRDNGKDKLHQARWSRLPGTSISDWWKEVPVKREERICNLDMARFGNCCNVSQFAIKVRHDRRTLGLQVKHFLPQNAAAENKAMRTIMKQAGAGFSCENTLDFSEAESVRDVTLAVLNLQAVDSILWPCDYTGNVILRVAAHFGYWAGYNLDNKVQISIYKTLVKEVLRKNAERWEKPPMMYEEMVREAESTMEMHGCPVVKPFMLKKLKEAANSNNLDRRQGKDRRDFKTEGGAGKPGGPTRDPKFEGIWDRMAEVRGMRCCLAYNKKARCGRTLSGDVCADAGSKFKYVHACCKKVSGVVCGKSHPAIDH